MIYVYSLCVLSLYHAISYAVCRMSYIYHYIDLLLASLGRCRPRCPFECFREKYRTTPCVPNALVALVAACWNWKIGIFARTQSRNPTSRTTDFSLKEANTMSRYQHLHRFIFALASSCLLPSRRRHFEDRAFFGFASREDPRAIQRPMTSS